MTLSILIPSTFDRSVMLHNLLRGLYHQIKNCYAEDKVTIITDEDNGEISVGKKRQSLLERAESDYVVQIDSDDEVPDYYIEEILKAIETNPDVIGFTGFMTTDGRNVEAFRISKDLPYITMWDSFNNKTYLRFNNHLSPIKREIALKIGFKDMRFGEDYDYAKRLNESGLIKTEKFINKDMYHYKYISTKTK